MNDILISTAKNILRSLSEIIIYSNIKKDLVVKSIEDYARSVLYCASSSATACDDAEIIESYGNIYRSLSVCQDTLRPDLTDHMLRLCREDDNLFSQTASKIHLTDAQNIIFDNQKWILNEFDKIIFLARLNAETLWPENTNVSSFPHWTNNTKALADSSALYADLIDFHRSNGFGLLSQHHFFTWSNARLRPVLHPDNILPDQLFEYVYERSIINKNTEKLFSRQFAENILLFGARGTGKSSTVKAVANANRDRGLRLIEVDKENILCLSELLTYLSELRHTCLSFIIFLDDIVLEEQDAKFRMLKKVLEGGVSVKPDNTVIYATSNRRHIVAEKLDNDLYENDAREEKLSLSDRFGLSVRFASPNNAIYLSIVHALLQYYGVEYNRVSIEHEALEWSMRHNGRSPRTARQFVDTFRCKNIIKNKDGHTNV